MHAALEILLAVMARIDDEFAPGGPVVRFVRGAERTQGEGGDAGLVLVGLGGMETSDITVSMNEEIQTVVVDIGYSAPIRDVDITGYEPMLELDDLIMPMLIKQGDSTLNGFVHDIVAGTIEPTEEDNADIGEIVRHLIVQYNASRWTPTRRLPS